MTSSEFTRQIQMLSEMLGCPPGAARELAHVFKEVGGKLKAQDAQVLMNEGDARGNTGFLLLAGHIEVVKGNSVVATLSAPALLGEMQQYSISGQRSATVRVMGRCRVLQFNWQAFYEALEPRLRPLDFQAVKEAIRRYSWQHFEVDDE